jgi:hypothetical protein
MHGPNATKKYANSGVKIWMYLDDITLLGPSKSVSAAAQESITAALLHRGHIMGASANGSATTTTRPNS